MKMSIKVFTMAVVILGSTSFLSACSTREMLAGGAGAAGGYVVGKNVD